MTRLPPGIRITADAFGTRWVSCVYDPPWLYAEHVGHVSHAVPVRIEWTRGAAREAQRVQQMLRAVGYECVTVIPAE